MKSILFFIFFLLSSLTVLPRQMPATDSSEIHVRVIPEKVIKSYKNNPAYDYEKVIPQDKSIVERIMDWIWSKYDELMSMKYGLLTRNIIFLIIGIATIAFFFYKILKGNNSGIFEANRKKGSGFSLEVEDLHQINFDEAIQSALSAGNYNVCIRLLYLKSMKILSEKNLINWQINKTNSTYIHELEKPAIRQPFEALTRYFERVYYGNARSEKNDYDEMNEKFLKLNEQL